MTKRAAGAPEIAAIERASRAAEALRAELASVHERVSALRAQAASAEDGSQRMLDAARRETATRAGLTALPHARLLSDSLALDGAASQRLGVQRRSVGPLVERSFQAWMGVTQCTSEDPEVRAQWNRLLAREKECGDLLRGLPSTVLDVPDAVVSIAAPGRLRVAMTSRHQQESAARESVPLCAVPRFTYDCPPRKRRNFGHWLLDCVPQATVLSALGPDAVFLLPEPVLPFHRSTLSLMGVSDDRVRAWDGAPIRCDRVLAFESDGRTGGGRPLSALLEVRRRLASPTGWSSPAAGRRIYVSRRDARARRQWVANEADVENVFASVGFEVLVMADRPLDEQVRIFREASIVAGISGAGLSDIVFSAPGTHVIALISDSLIRWYAAESGQRSAWTGARPAATGQLAALGDSPRFYAHLAAAFEQYCHCFVGSDEMPIDRLSAFVGDVLKWRERA